MIKAEPKSILNFLAAHFDTLKDLFDIQSEDNIIRKERLQEVFKERQDDVLTQLLEIGRAHV